MPKKNQQTKEGEVAETAQTNQQGESPDILEHIVVRVGRLPGIIQDIALNGGRTVADALEGAGLSAEGYEVRVNGAIGDTNTALVAADTVLLVRKIAGN